MSEEMETHTRSDAREEDDGVGQHQSEAQDEQVAGEKEKVDEDESPPQGRKRSIRSITEEKEPVDPEEATQSQSQGRKRRNRPETSDTQKEEGTTDNPGSKQVEDAGEEEEEKVTDEATHKGRKKRVRPKRPTKLTPACASCKKSKIRCTHRVVIVDAGDVPRNRKRETSIKAPAPGDGNGVVDNAPAAAGVDVVDKEDPPVKRARRVRLKSNEEEAHSESEPEASQKQARRRKRKHIDENTSTAATIDDINPGPSTQPPNQPSQSIQGPPTTDPEEQPNSAPIPLQVFPTDSLEGSALLSRHTILSRELQRRLEECETTWLKAIESLQGAKQALDNWVDLWRRGL